MIIGYINYDHKKWTSLYLQIKFYFLIHLVEVEEPIIDNTIDGNPIDVKLDPRSGFDF